MTHSRSALELRTPRLHLRTLRPEDAAPLAAYRSLPEVARYQAWEGFDLAAAERLVADQAGIVPNTAGTWLQLALGLAESGSVVGDCGLHFLADDPRQVELGITLAPAHQGRGLAAEALTAVLTYLFGDLEKHRVIAVTDADNRPAAALFRRLGFRLEGTFVENCWFKGAWGSECLFAQLRREWVSNGPAIQPPSTTRSPR